MGVKIDYINDETNNFLQWLDLLSKANMKQESLPTVSRNFNWAYEVNLTDDNYNDR